jgi:hypothetical protein
MSQHYSLPKSHSSNCRGRSRHPFHTRNCSKP